MKTNHVLDQLSAYIDGEADHPELVARHLQQCAECARRHMELSKLSAHIKALPPTEPHPAFLTRVMANVAETEQASKRSWRPWWSLATVAMGVLLVCGATYFSTGTNRVAPASMASANPSAAPQAVDENALMQQIEERLALGSSTPLLEGDDGTPYVEAEGAPETLADVANNIDQLASHRWDGTVSDDGEAEPVLDTALDTLSDTEAQTFANLLDEYARKDLSS